MNVFNGKGQINMDTTFGKNIYNICKQNDIMNIIEVGTWNGQGSTVCVMNAIINKPNSTLYSLESCQDKYNDALHFWKNYDTKNKLQMLKGVLHQNILTRKEIQECGGEVVEEWYIQESNNIVKSNIINLDCINNVDVIILDGGEYSTLNDFNTLMQKTPSFIILDDVNSFKCKNIRAGLLNDTKWEVYCENLIERNGWSIFKKRTELCKIPVSIGELWDKYSILLIKREQITDNNKLEHVLNEIKHLEPYINMYHLNDELQTEIKECNKTLWDIEDAIREKEKTGTFDDSFIQLARSVYITNDLRCEIKTRINIAFKSSLFEVKSYEK